MNNGAAIRVSTHPSNGVIGSTRNGHYMGNANSVRGSNGNPNAVYGGNPNGERITAHGDRITANGDRITPNGDRITANGDRITPNGERISANGERIFTGNSNGTVTVTIPPQHAMGEHRNAAIVLNNGSPHI